MIVDPCDILYLEEEKQFIDSKLAFLELFVETNRFRKVAVDEQLKISRQLELMRAYSEILDARMIVKYGLFEDAHKFDFVSDLERFFDFDSHNRHDSWYKPHYKKGDKLRKSRPDYNDE